MTNSFFTLSEAPIGKMLHIHQLASSPEVCLRLREIGFCENAVVRCVSRLGTGLICEVCNTKIGLNSTIAADILVSQSE